MYPHIASCTDAIARFCPIVCAMLFWFRSSA
jgi:hypothetical protein